MKKTLLFIAFISTLLLVSCTKTLDKPLNKKDFPKVKEFVAANEEYTLMKKKFIVDNLSRSIGLDELSESLIMDETEKPTFRMEIEKLSNDFDSIKNEKLKIIENNKKLSEFLILKSADTKSVDKYKGYFSMTLDFNNQFEKDILYIIFNYKYINKYDTEYFDEKSKLTDEVAGNFKSEITITITEEYNDVADFMYTKVPYGYLVRPGFLMSGLKVETLGIVFTDKTEIFPQNADWEYFEN